MIDIKMQSAAPQRLAPKITVVGVGGAGGNAVNNMISSGLDGCEFLVCNTDSQALEGSLSNAKLQLGTSVTGGLGAGARPEIGMAAAEENLEEITQYLEGSNMVFVTAGMGGGTGTGAAPVIAKACRDKGILTVGVVTKPFHFEGAHRMAQAEAGLEEMQDYVDTLIVIPNQNLFRIANEKTTFADGFRMADDVLKSGVSGVTDLIVRPGLVNLDFADIKTAMQEMGKAMMGTGEATGEKRAVDAAEAAINNPLLDDVSMKGAKGVIINITGGFDMTLFETDEACNRIRDEVDPNANIIFGTTFDKDLDGSMRVSIVATGIDKEECETQGRDETQTQPEQKITPNVVTNAPTEQEAITSRRTNFGTSSIPKAPPRKVDAASLLNDADGELFEQNVFVTDSYKAPAKKVQSSSPQANTHNGSFIPPKPVEVATQAPAAQRTSVAAGYHQRANATPASSISAPLSARRNSQSPQPEQTKSQSFLERLATSVQGAKETFSAGQDSQGKLNVNALSPVGTKTSSVGQGKSDDGLDIPAFLRRQAN